MFQKISLTLDKASEFFARRKGLLPIIGLLFILVNVILQIFPVGWLTQSNLFLNIGIILAIIGFMMAWTL